MAVNNNASAIVPFALVQFIESHSIEKLKNSKNLNCSEPLFKTRNNFIDFFASGYSLQFSMKSPELYSLD